MTPRRIVHAIGLAFLMGCGSLATRSRSEPPPPQGGGVGGLVEEASLLREVATVLYGDVLDRRPDAPLDICGFSSDAVRAVFGDSVNRDVFVLAEGGPLRSFGMTLAASEDHMFENGPSGAPRGDRVHLTLWTFLIGTPLEAHFDATLADDRWHVQYCAGSWSTRTSGP